MKRLYSPTTGATYFSSIHGKEIPADAIEISEERFREVILNPPPNKIRGHDENGLPILVDPPPHVDPTPQTVSMRQARLAMLYAGILDDVEAMIYAMEGPEGKAAQIDWEFAADVKRDWPLISALGVQLGMTEEQIDEMFVAAAAIPK